MSTKKSADGGLERNQVTRSFWARYLESKVSADGQVLGFQSWWNNAMPRARSRGAAYAESCWLKVSRDGRDVSDVITAGVAAFRAELRMTRMAEEAAKDPEYAAFRFGLVQEILRDSLRPFEVAAMLDREHDRFTQIRDDEIDELREWGEHWGGPIPDGKLLWNPRTHQLEKWPHAKIPVFTPTPEQVRAPLYPTKNFSVPITIEAEDEAPPPQYADETPPPEVAR